MEAKPDTEQEQDDADLGELFGNVAIRGEAWRERADENAGEDVSDNRRNLQPLRDEATNERGREPASKGREDVELTHGALRWAKFAPTSGYFGDG